MEKFLVYGGLVILILFLFIAYINEKIEQEKRQKILLLRENVDGERKQLDQAKTIDDSMTRLDNMIRLYESWATVDTRNAFIVRDLMMAKGYQRGFEAQKNADELLQQASASTSTSEQRIILEEAIVILLDAKNRNYGYKQNQFEPQLSQFSDLADRARIEEFLEKAQAAEDVDQHAQALRLYGEGLFKLQRLKNQTEETTQKIDTIKEKLLVLSKVAAEKEESDEFDY